MERIERYLKQVRAYLPASQQNDIARELEENLRSQIEDREAELGRPLNDDEQDELLRQLGPPLEVAGRYRSEKQTFTFGRQLIGPALFPFYARVLRINLGLTSIAVVAIALVLRSSFGQTIQALAMQVLIQGGIVTAIFIAADRHLANHPDSWAAKPNLKANRDQAPNHPRFDAFAQLVASGVFALWLLTMRESLTVFVNSGAAPLRPAPVWLDVYWPTLLIALAYMIQAGISLLRPEWARFRSLGGIAINGAGVILTGYLVSAGPWVSLGEQVGDSLAKHQQAAEWVNHYLFYNLLLILVIAVGQWLWQCYREWRKLSRPA